MWLKPKLFLTGIVLFAIVTAALFAQWAVDMNAATRIQPNGAVTSVRYGNFNRIPLYSYSSSGMTRLMPSESRFLTSASGYLPSENRMMSMQAGLLPSQGRAAYLMPQSLALSSNPLPVSAYVAGSSLRYGSSASRFPIYNTYSTAVLPPFAPNPMTGLAPTGSAPASYASVPNLSIRYGRTSAPSPVSIPSFSNAPVFSSSAPLSSQVIRAPSSSGLSAVSPTSSFSPWPGSPRTVQSVRYGHSIP